MFLLITMKFVIALISALAIPTAATASVADAFDNHNVAKGGFNGCWKPANGSLVCVQSMNEAPNIRTVAIVDARSNSPYPSTILVNCTTREWEGYGASSQANMKAIANAACDAK
jgi:hypothetical protein